MVFRPISGWALFYGAWVMINYSAIKCFFFFALFSLIISDSSFANTLSVSALVANIRSGPGTGYDVLWQVEKYHPIKKIKGQNSWYYFQDFEGDRGWINKRIVKKIESVITIKKTCNVRSGPGKKFKVLFTVEKGIPFKVLKREGNWINIEHSDGDKGWIYKTLVW